MGDSDDCTTIFGPDGSITDPVLLQLIKEAKPLPPKDLLKLVGFFAKISTYAVLTERLAVYALFGIITRPTIAKDVQTIFGFDPDYLEDTAIDLAWPPTLDERWPRPEDSNANKMSRVLVPGTNVGLLIETQDEKSFAVAVSPDPTKLPDKPDDQDERIKLLLQRIARDIRHIFKRFR